MASTHPAFDAWLNLDLKRGLNLRERMVTVVEGGSPGYGFVIKVNSDFMIAKLYSQDDPYMTIGSFNKGNDEIDDQVDDWWEVAKDTPGAAISKTTTRRL